MAEMKSLTLKGKYYEIVDERARNTIERNCSPVLTETAEGFYNAVEDSANKPLQCLRVFGKSEQVNTRGLQLFDCSKIVRNTYIQTSSDGVLTIDCDNTNSSAAKYAAFYTPVSTLLKPSTQYAIVLEVFSTTSVGETYYMTSIQANEAIQFTTAEKLEAPAVGIHTMKVTTVSNFDQCVYMCRNFVTIPAGVHLRATIRLSVWADPNVTHGSFKYEPFSDGLVIPNLANPQDIKSVNNPVIGVCSGNLLDQYEAFSMTGNTAEISKVVYDNALLLMGTPSKNYVQITTGSIEIPAYWKRQTLKFGVTIKGNQPHVVLYFRSSSKSILNEVALSATSEKLIVVPEDAVYYEFAFCLNRTTNGTYYTAEYKNMYLSVVDATSGYQQYIPQQTMQIPRLLNGIPVEEDGCYTDSNGQQWICDEVDLKRGVHLKRVASYTFSGADNEDWRIGYSSDGVNNRFQIMIDNVVFSYKNCATATSAYSAKNAMCSHFKYYDMSQIPPTDGFRISHSVTAERDIWYALFNPDTSVVPLEDIAAWKAYLAENPITVVVPLDVPVVTSLTDEEIEAFKQLYSNHPSTTVMNDSGAWMKTEYAADLKLFIHKLLK